MNGSGDQALRPQHWRMLDAAEVRDWDCQPLVWLVEGMIALGNLVILAASTQTGKTLLGLVMALRMACGGMLFGKYEAIGSARILYLVLEDPDRRIRDRLVDIQSGEPELEPEPGNLRLYFASGFKLNDDDFFEHLEELIVQGGFQAVFIDTYQKATPGLSSFKDEDQSKILHKLSDLTRKHGVALIVLDHLRKPPSGKNQNTVGIDDIKGTGGKAQNADAIILLKKQGSHVDFHCFSKDADQPVHIRLEVSPQGSRQPKYQFLKEIQDSSSKSADQTRIKVREAVERGETVTSAEVAKRTGLSQQTVCRYLDDLVKDEQFKREGNKRWTKYTRCRGVSFHNFEKSS